MQIASTTKIMTAIITIENSSSNDIFTVSENAQNQEGSSVYLKKGQKITQKELLYALMLNSGNDAAMTLAENIGKTEARFVKMMNEKASELNLKNTHFENPSGLPSDNHYSTAYDMAIIMAYAIENDYFNEIISKKEYTLQTETDITYLRNHNKLLWKYPYCVGGKTGYTKTAGRCLVSVSKKEDKSIICVTLNQPDDWQYHINNSDIAFKKIKNTKIIEKNNILTTKIINNTPVNIIAKEDLTIPVIKKKNLICKITLTDCINRDIKIGEEIGTGNIYYKNNHIATIKLLSGGNINAKPKNVFIKNFNYTLHHFLLTKNE